MGNVAQSNTSNHQYTQWHCELTTTLMYCRPRPELFQNGYRVDSSDARDKDKENRQPKGQGF